MTPEDENYLIEQFTLSDNDFETLSVMITSAFNLEYMMQSFGQYKCLP